MSETKRRARVRVARELIVERLFPDGTEIVNVRMEWSGGWPVIEFVVEHDDLAEVSEGNVVPLNTVVIFDGWRRREFKS